MKEIKYQQYKVPHCKHCKWYKETTNTCVNKLMHWGLGSRAKACNSRNCTSFEPKEEYKNNYKDYKMDLLNKSV